MTVFSRSFESRTGVVPANRMQRIQKAALINDSLSERIIYVYYSNTDWLGQAVPNRNVARFVPDFSTNSRTRAIKVAKSPSKAHNCDGNWKKFTGAQAYQEALSKMLLRTRRACRYCALLQYHTMTPWFQSFFLLPTAMLNNMKQLRLYISRSYR